jgi:enolase
MAELSRGLIKRVWAREVLDSRGLPTVEAEVWLESGDCGSAIAPSGASTGRSEACELRDGDSLRYDGRGVLRAVRNVREEIGPALVGQLAAEQVEIDRLLADLDGTPNLSRLGANAIVAVSLAAAHAAAQGNKERLPLVQHFSRLAARAAGGEALPPLRMPTPMVNLISGGLHAGGNLDFQDFLGIPVGAPDFATGLEWIVRVYRRLGELLAAAGFEGRLVGDEGGFGPRLPSNRAALEVVVRAIEAAKLRPGVDMAIALDVAATHFFDGERYRLAATGGERLTAADLVGELAKLVDAFPILSIEDGLAEDDWAGWQELTRRLGKRVRLVGDDLFVTQLTRLERGINEQVASAVLLKPNQVGTVSGTIAAAEAARKAGYLRVVSARSGETEDTTIADLAVGLGAEQIKIGSMVRGERLVKYNRLLRIAEVIEQA